MDYWLLSATAAMYMAGTIAAFGYLLRPRERTHTFALGLMGVGFALHAAALMVRGVTESQLPLTNLRESVSFLAWLLVAAYCVAHWKYRVEVLAVFLFPLVAMLTLFSLLLPSPAPRAGTPLETPLFWIHTLFSFIGVSALFLAAAFGVMYLLQESALKQRRLGKLYYLIPSLSVCENISQRALVWGFIAFTLGLVTGGLWSHQAKGTFVQFSAKESWALVTWLIFALTLQARLAAGWRGRRTIYMSLAGAATLLGALLGIRGF